MNANSKGYVFIEPEHPIVQDAFERRIETYAETGKMDSLMVEIGDFDGVTYRIGTDMKQPSLIKMDVTMPNLKDLKNLGATRVLNKKYGSYMKSAPTKNYDLSLEVDTSKKPDPKEYIQENDVDASVVYISENTTNVLQDVGLLMSLLKRNILGVPLEDTFDSLLAGSSGKAKPCIVKMRADEQMIVEPTADRVNVCFSIAFEEETDATFAEIFMQEFQDSNRSLGSAPSCKFSRDVPSTMRKLKGIIVTKNTVGFLTFSVLKTHIENGNRDKVVTLLLSFRHYLHYHIKACKAYLHSRMRNKVKELLLVLNQARPLEEDKKKKTFRGQR